MMIPNSMLNYKTGNSCVGEFTSDTTLNPRRLLSIFRWFLKLFGLAGDLKNMSHFENSTDAQIKTCKCYVLFSA